MIDGLTPPEYRTNDQPPLRAHLRFPPLLTIIPSSSAFLPQPRTLRRPALDLHLGPSVLCPRDVPHVRDEPRCDGGRDGVGAWKERDADLESCVKKHPPVRICTVLYCMIGGKTPALPFSGARLSPGRSRLDSGKALNVDHVLERPACRFHFLEFELETEASDQR
jgi:hypothetical protein